MTDVTVAELEDKDVVYMLGIAPELGEAAHEWFLSDEFDEQWQESFDSAEYVMVPASLDSVDVEGVRITNVDSVEWTPFENKNTNE